MTRGRVPGWRFAAAALLPLLGGCVAAAAIPVLTGGALIARGATDAEMRDGKDDKALARPERGTALARADEAAVAAAAARSGVRLSSAGAPPRAPSREAAVAGATAPGSARLTTMTELPPPSPAAAAGVAAAPMPGAARLTTMTELPPPSPRTTVRPAGRGAGPVGSSSWTAFAGYAVDQATAAAGGKARRSALLESPTSLTSPRFRHCDKRQPAVIIDLDPGAAAFAPAAAGAAGDELRGSLQRLRGAGIAVIWVSQQRADSSDAIRAALRNGGLDPAGRDRILLARSDERKQVLRDRAGQEACVVAIAGDRRGDFDELFDYLRDPAMAVMLDAQLGAGWFLVPPPLGATSGSM